MNLTMKKISKIFILPLILMSMASCNKAVVNNRIYSKVHLISKKKCYEISSWGMWDSGSMIQFTIKDSDTIMLANTQEAVLIQGTCPYCESL